MRALGSPTPNCLASSSFKFIVVVPRFQELSMGVITLSSTFKNYEFLGMDKDFSSFEVVYITTECSKYDEFRKIIDVQFEALFVVNKILYRIDCHLQTKRHPSR